MFGCEVVLTTLDYAQEIIDPAYTRRVCCEWVSHMYESLLPERILERVAGKLQPTFA
jgi:hypothetical protein